MSLEEASRRESEAKDRCRAITTAGRRCRNVSADSSGFCRVHGAGDKSRISKAPIEDLGTLGDQAVPSFEERARPFVEFFQRRLVGDYRVDVFGFDQELTEQVLHPIAMFFYKKYWRVTSKGVENVPETGPALLVANHSGTLPFDALMMKFGILEEHRARRHVRLLAADLAVSIPFISHLARKSGNTVAIEEDAIRLLEAGELVGVFPEGYKGVGKPYRERYRLQRFGRGGFVEVALRAQVPIVPVAIVGAEEIYPMVANVRPLARLLGLPYFPVTPFFPAWGPLGMIPLPSKWIIEYGEPIPTESFGAAAAEDAMLVFDLTDRVRDTIQQMIDRNLTERGGAFG